MSIIRMYQPERTDLLINADWGIPQDQLADDVAAARGLMLFQGRWVSRDEERRLRDEAGAYSSIRHFGNLLLFISILSLFWTVQAMRNNGVAGILVLVPGAACFAAGIGLRRYVLWGRTVAAVLFGLMILLPFIPAGADDKGGPLLILFGGGRPVLPVQEDRWQDIHGRELMATDEKEESTSLKVRRSLSQLSLAFAALGFIAGIAVMSPDDRFAGLSVMALGGAVPLIIGPPNLRKYGALAAAVGTAGVILLAGSGESSLYRTKARLQAVHDVGVEYSEAAAGHRQRTNAWPSGVAGLAVPKKPRTVSSVSFGTDGSITFVLSFPPVKDGALVFTPSGVNAPIAWTCRGNNIPPNYLPAACREK